MTILDRRQSFLWGWLTMLGKSIAIGLSTSVMHVSYAYAYMVKKQLVADKKRSSLLLRAPEAPYGSTASGIGLYIHDNGAIVLLKFIGRGGSRQEE